MTADGTRDQLAADELWWLQHALPVAAETPEAFDLAGLLRRAARAVAAVEVALKPHRRSLNPAWGQGSGDCHGKHFCIGCSIDQVYRQWPCKPYRDITSILLGEAKSDG